MSDGGRSASGSRSRPPAAALFAAGPRNSPACSSRSTRCVGRAARQATGIFYGLCDACSERVDRLEAIEARLERSGMRRAA